MKKSIYQLVILLFAVQLFMSCEEDSGFNAQQQRVRDDVVITDYLAETGADGYFLKPFDLNDFEKVFDLL